MPEIIEQNISVTEVKLEEATTQATKPRQESFVPPMPKNPEPFATATLKGTVEAAATFVVAAATPLQNGETPPVKPVQLFDKEPDNRSTLEAFRQKTAEQMSKREQKTATPGRTRAEEPAKLAAMERRAEPTRLQRLAQIRTQIARVPVRASMQKAA